MEVNFPLEVGRASFFCRKLQKALVKSRSFLTVIEGTMLHF